MKAGASVMATASVVCYVTGDNVQFKKCSGEPQQTRCWTQHIRKDLVQTADSSNRKKS